MPNLNKYRTTPFPTAEEFELEFWTECETLDRHAFAEAYAAHITKELRVELRIWKKDDQGCD